MRCRNGPVLPHICHLLPVVILIVVVVVNCSLPHSTVCYAVFSVVVTTVSPRAHVNPHGLLRALVSNIHRTTGVTVPATTYNVVVNVIIGSNITIGVTGLVNASNRNDLFVTLLVTTLNYLLLNVTLPAITTCLVTIALFTSTVRNLNVSTLIAGVFVFCFNIITRVAPPIYLTSFATTNVTNTDT